MQLHAQLLNSCPAQLQVRAHVHAYAGKQLRSMHALQETGSWMLHCHTLHASSVAFNRLGCILSACVILSPATALERRRWPDSRLARFAC